KTVVRSALSTRVKHVPPGGETDEEATFSADDDDADDVIADVIKPTEVRKRKISIEPPTPVQLKISRPSFQPLDVVLASDEVVELLQHPEFGLSTRYEMSHHVTPGASFQPAMNPDKLDRRREIFKRGHLSVTFRQTVPFQTSNDCPYVAGGEDVVKSMLRGMYGVWQEDPSEDKVAAAEKVEWVRDVLIRF
uniref:Uncharacterized protein n=1 Tax=Ciona savignyi TaxID=51511 RepID=H2YNH4_CIOSA